MHAVRLGMALTAASILFGCSDRAAQEAVAASMRDPDAAQFRDTWSSSRGFCGQVNGTNGLGAYGGFRPFWYNTRSKNLQVLDLSAFSTMPDEAVAAAQAFGARQRALCGPRTKTIF